MLWLDSGDTAAQRLLQPPTACEEEQAWVERSLVELRSSSVVEQAKDLAKSHAERASKALAEALGNDLGALNPAGEALFAVIDFALERVL